MRRLSRINHLLAGMIACFALLASPAGVQSADSPAAESSTGAPPDLDLVQQASEKLRREADASLDAARQQADNALLSTRVGLIERTLSLQHERELEVLQSSHRTVLLIAGIFAGVGLVGILCAAFILVRAMNRFSEMVVNIPMGRALAPAQSLAVLGAGDFHSLPAATPSDPVNTRFIDAIERLERRIGDLEHTAQPPALPAATEPPTILAKSLPPQAVEATSGEVPQLSISAVRSKKTNGPPEAATSSPALPDRTAQTAMLLGKGQALLNLGEANEALECFDKALTLEPGHADALVRRGMALEKLQKMEEAIDSYDRAIAANGSMTLAYLYKGAVCNRMQRFREALECYEKALQSEQPPGGS